MQQIGVEKILDPSHRARVSAGIDSVIDVVEAMINPFDYERSELINIYSGSSCIPSLPRFHENLRMRKRSRASFYCPVYL